MFVCFFNLVGKKKCSEDQSSVLLQRDDESSLLLHTSGEVGGPSLRKAPLCPGDVGQKVHDRLVRSKTLEITWVRTERMGLFVTCYVTVTIDALQLHTTQINPRNIILRESQE